MATDKSVDAIVDEVLWQLGANGLSKADPQTDPDERSPGSGDPAGTPPEQELSEDPSGAPPGEAPEESLEEIYGSMSPEELAEHMEALQKVLAAKAGQGSEPSPAPGPQGPPAGAPPAPMMRSEAALVKGEVLNRLQTKGHFHPERGCQTCAQRDLVKAEHQKFVDLEKSHRDMEVQLKQVGDAAVSALRLLTGAKPLRKSMEGISEISFVPRDGVPQDPARAHLAAVQKMSATEIAAVLNQKIPTLAKAEQEKVIGFYEGRLKVSNIAHLLA